ncbi:uncharacterized protein LOC118193230 [Stegodyphus dumicola]|uniref:uncharacterized protein LOC118193230 n=1 Tax=Stegodyphus dumicola TaxID=202533 RepID=UPI0015AA85E2|nr:uncharacterized protein LOC118193230 [Stegodyphus dumicola]
MFDRIITSNKEKLTSKIRDLRNRYKTSLTLSSQIIQNESGWIISSENNLDLYTIQKVISEGNCELKCTECNVCIHTYMCTCIDTSIKWNMCKHIHYLCQMQKNSPADTVHDFCNDPSLIIDDTNDIVIVNELMQSTSQTLTLAERKIALLNKFTSLLNSITTPNEVTKMEKIYKSAINTSIPHFEPPTVNIPANKKIVQQRTFKQTKRRKIMKNLIRTSVQNFPLTVMINNKTNIQGQHSS